jgi:hypothetical protein
MEIKENCSSVFQFGRKSIEKIKILKWEETPKKLPKRHTDQLKK